MAGEVIAKDEGELSGNSDKRRKFQFGAVHPCFVSFRFVLFFLGVVIEERVCEITEKRTVPGRYRE